MKCFIGVAFSLAILSSCMTQHPSVVEHPCQTSNVNITTTSTNIPLTDLPLTLSFSENSVLLVSRNGMVNYERDGISHAMKPSSTMQEIFMEEGVRIDLCLTLNDNSIEVQAKCHGDEEITLRVIK